MNPDRLTHLACALERRDGIAGWRAGGDSVRFDALARRVRAWAALAARQPGGAIALYIDDSLEFACALLGAWQAGKTAWLAPDALPATCAGLRPNVGAFFGDFPAAREPQWPAAGDSAAGALRELDPGFEALVVHTSGTTGAAQSIPKRLSQIDSELQVLEQAFGARIGGAAVVATVSHQHIYGLLFRVLWPLCAGRPVYAATVAYPEELATLLGRQRSVLVSSPAHLTRLAAHIAWPSAQMAAVFSSGGPLPEEAALSCAGLLGQAPVEVYGSSESGGVAWRQRAEGRGDAWQPLPGVEWRVGEGGAFELRSPHLRDSAWFAMADRARDAGDNRFQLLGRADRIVKVEGKRVSLDAIEAALRASHLVDAVRIVADEDAHARLSAFVVPSTAGHAVLAQQGKLALNGRLRALLEGVVERVALPRRWRYIEAMPVNAQGKTPAAALLALLDGPEERPAAAPRPRAAGWTETGRSDNVVQLALSIPADLMYFDGHFPGTAILPGVVQLDWAIAHGRRLFALPPRFAGVANLKFQNVILPGSTVELQLEHDSAKGALHFRYLSGALQHSSGRVLFSANPT